MKVYPTIRIYFERGNGRAVLDQGHGTARTEVEQVHMTGQFFTDHAEPGPPRFWIVAKNCTVHIHNDIAYVMTERA
jgi:hypothetical protein